MNTRTTCGWAAGALVAFLIGCGGGGEVKTVTVESDEPAPGGDATAEGTAAPSATPGPDGQAAAIAQSAGTADGKPVRFVLTELRRSGPTVILNARLELADGADSAQVADTFDDGSYQDLEANETESGDVFDGVAMVDPEGRKKYLVARDETGRCVCTNALNGQFAREDSAVQLTATLTAPPAEVTQIDLLIPHFETLRGVAISE